MKTFNRVCGAILLISFCAGLYFTEGQRPGESDLAYIWRDPALASMETLCEVIWSITFALWLMGNLGNGR